jgi:hypothetical protein
MEVADLEAATADINDVEVLGKTYWPASLQAYDFRGHQGIMVCGLWKVSSAACVISTNGCLVHFRVTQASFTHTHRALSVSLSSIQALGPLVLLYSW